MSHQQWIIGLVLIVVIYLALPSQSYPGNPFPQSPPASSPPQKPEELGNLGQPRTNFIESDGNTLILKFD